MEAMGALLLFAFIFLCVLVSFLFSLFSKLFPSLRSPISKTASTPNDAEKNRGQLDHLDELKSIFSMFDTNKDGFISKEELSESLSRLGFPATEAEVMDMMEEVDADGDGLINLSEFRKLCVGMDGDEKGEEDRELRAAFMVFDGDGDGLITVKELSSVLKSLGLKQGDSADDCRKMIKSVDSDGDGMVNFEEFKKMMVVKGGKIF